MATAADRSFLGHPRGLAVLFTTEGFTAFAQYGLQSILVLALSASILRPGASDDMLGLAALQRWLGVAGRGGSGSADAGAAMIAGLFGALLYVAPMLGGVIADRVLGHTRAVIAGLALFTAGLAMLVARPLFLLGLLVLVVGFGLAGTTKAQVGALYAADDPRRSNGFQLYSFATLIAVVFAPMICGTLGEGRAWSLGFAAAAAGGLLALLFYLFGHGTLRPKATVAAGPDRTPVEPRSGVGAGAEAGTLRSLDRRDWMVVGGLVLLLPVLALDCVGNMEIFDGYLLWAKQHYDLRWFGHQMPVSWLLSLDAFISMVATAVSIAAWTWFERRGRPVDDLWRITIGTVLCALAVLVLAAAPAGRVGLGWGLAFHMINDLGNTNTYMVSMALYSRLAPAPLRATVTNACASQIFLANLMVAQLASRLDVLGPTRFWLIHAVLIGAAAIVLAAVAIGATTGRRRRTSFRAQPVRTV